MRIFLGLVILFLTYMYLFAYYANNLDKIILSLLTLLFIGVNFFVINTHNNRVKPILLSVLLILLFNLYWVNFKLYEESYLSFLPQNVVEVEFLAPFAFIYLLFTLLTSLVISKIFSFIKGKENSKTQINGSYKKEEILPLEENTNSSPVLIKGDERLDVEPIGVFGKYIIFVWNLFLVFITILSIFQGKFEFGYALLGWFISNIIIVFTLRVLYLFTPSYHRRCDEVDKINSYFKRSYDLLNEFNHKEHTNLGVFNKSSKIDSEHAMFDLYMEAYKMNADAIVLNASNIATSVSGDRKRVRSSTTHHLTGTIVKYK